jgi:hypothetical protein
MCDLCGSLSSLAIDGRYPVRVQHQMRLAPLLPPMAGMSVAYDFVSWSSSLSLFADTSSDDKV